MHRGLPVKAEKADEEATADAAFFALVGHDVGRLEIKTRGFASRPEEVLRQLRPKGSRRAVLFLTRLNDRPTAILAERLAGL